MSISIRNVSKSFGSFQALSDVSLEVPSGSLLALLGPSGSGKTTLLRIIAGLEQADTGTILVQDSDVTQLTAREREVGFVFQHYALFKHMSVFENIAFGMRVRHIPDAEVKARVNELLHLVRLEGLGTRYPRNSRGDNGSVWLLRGLWPSSRDCCCSTSRSERSMPKCGRSCERGSASCMKRCTSRRCS